MFAPKVAKPGTKTAETPTRELAPQRATLAARPFGGDALGLPRFLQHTIGNQATLRLLAQRATNLTWGEPRGHNEQEADPARLTTRGAKPGISWNFAKISVFPPYRPRRPQPSPPGGATPVLGAIQAKLVLEPVDDPLENNADRVPDQMMHMPAPDINEPTNSQLISRKCAACGDEETVIRAKPVGRALTPGSGGAPSIVHDVVGSSGRPLRADVRGRMEAGFGHDFEHVRIQTDAKAAESARAVNALAYTADDHIVLGTGQYVPDTPADRELLAHELAHTIQHQAVQAASPNATGRSVYEGEVDVGYNTVSSGISIQRLMAQNEELVLRQPADTEELPAIEHDFQLDPNMFLLPSDQLPADQRSPTQQRLDSFRDGMKASYHTPDGGTAMVAPPFGISDGYPGQKATANTEPRPTHLKNIILKLPRIAQIITRVQYARGSPDEIHTVTQALLDDDALNDEATAGSLEQNIRQMMFNYRIGTDCAGYVQQAFLSSQQMSRSAAKLNPNILNEDLSNLQSKGFTRIDDPLSAAPGDLVVFDPPNRRDYGHRAIVYSRREVNEAEKQDLLGRPDPCLTDFFAIGSASVLELDSSWGSGGDPQKGGIQRRKFFYNPLAKLNWVRLDPNTDRAVCDNEMYAPDILKGFYRMKT